MDIDHLDRKILKQLQISSDISLDHLGAMIGLSRNAVWRRVKVLEANGIIMRRVALVDPEKLDLGLLVFIQIKSAQHSIEWTEQLAETAQGIAQIISLYRMSGDLDYLIKARVRDISDYDRLYRRLIKRLPLMDVSASFVTESLKSTTEIPVFI